MNISLLIFSIVLFFIFSLRYNWWRQNIAYKYPRILMYHSIEEHKGDKFDKWRVKPSDFEKQIAWLSKNNFISYTMTELTSLNEIPQKAVCITFDDGYEDNFTNAYKILKKYNFKATIYLVPNQKTNHWEKNNTSFVSNMLNRDQIRQMSDIIEFGSHTMNHINLEKSSLEDVKSEMIISKHSVEEISGKECVSFAYPYGKYTDLIVDICKEVGYKNAVIVKRGIYKNSDDKFKIKRIGVLGTESFFDFWLKFKKIRNKL